jgi:Concanavalin A-like lectin/glucanases superfamily
MRREIVLLLTVAGVLAWSAAPASADPNILAKWTLDEGAGQLAADASGHANTGVLGAAPGADPADPGWIAGHAGGGALVFDGSNYVTITNTGLLEPPRLAVDAWVRRAGSPGRWRYVLSNGSLQCNRSAYGLYSGWSGGMGFYVSGATEYVISPEVSPAIVWDGGWHHIIGSYDGDRVRLWIDGSQVGAGTPSSGAIVYSGSGGIYVGTYRGSCDLGFSGAIDDVTVWDDRPAEATTGGTIDPVADAPTRIAIGAADSASAPAGATAPSQGCMRVSLNRHTIPIRRMTKLVATVRRGSHRVAGVRLAISGRGVTTKGRRTTDRKGNTKLSVRARKAGHLKVKVSGQKAGCSSPTIRVR